METSEQIDPAAPSGRKRSRRWLVAVAVVAIAMLFPFEREVTPAWSFDVVDVGNKDLPGCRVEQHWEWRSVGLERSEAMTSDAGGRVRFPRRTVRASFARQWYGALSGLGFHAAFMGPRAYFTGCAPGPHPDRLDTEKVGEQMVYRYVPGSQISGKPRPQE